MSDRELLEFAAKAAGIDVRWYQGDCLRVADKCNGFAGKWNPLTDDGDAFRLAVRLGLHVFQLKHYVRCGRKNIDMPIEESKREQDPLAATRRAIVRAAAQIGRSMK